MKWLWLPKFILTLLLFLGAAYLLVAFNYSYSDGSRAGYIQKFSHKGLDLQDERRGAGHDHGAGCRPGIVGLFSLG